MLESVFQWIVATILSIIGLIITGVVTKVVIPRFVEYLSAKTNCENMKTVIADLGDTVSTSVAFLNQTVVSRIKEEGKWNSESQKLVLKAAVSEVMQSLSHTTRDIIHEDRLNLEQIVTRRIEAELDNRKLLISQHEAPAPVSTWEQYFSDSLDNIDFGRTGNI